MKKQYLHIKSKYPKAIVLITHEGHVFTFDDDETILKKVCSLSSGFQETLQDFTLNQLTKAGYQVAIAEALKEPAHAAA